jgi:hypothetical protein
MSVEQYRRQVAQKEKTIANLLSQKSRAFEKVVATRKKGNDAASAAMRTTNSSMASAKLREVQRYADEEARAMKEVSTIEQKISTESIRLNQENQRLQHALASEHRKQEQQQKKRLAEQKQIQDDQERSQRAHELTIHSMNADLARHERLHSLTASELERLNALPQKIVVAFFASDPGRDSTTRLGLDEEARSIGEKIRSSKHRDAVQLQTRWAVRPLDILQAINELSPTIVHFSGHGSDQDELILQDDRGQPKLISKQAIVHTISVASESVRLVVFNTCFSFNQAQESVKHVDAAIGMNTAIGDEAARVFSSQLYSAIAFGRSVVAAFNQAKAALMMEASDEAETPRLYIKEGILDSDLVLVKPEGRG